jgi:hypothetical protein
MGFSVLGTLPLGSQHLLDPGRHRIAELLEILSADLGGPQHLYLVDELGDGADILVLELSLHEIPSVFNRVEVRTVARPIDNLEGLLGKVGLNLLGSMTWGPILKEMGRLVDVHEGDEMVI